MTTIHRKIILRSTYLILVLLMFTNCAIFTNFHKLPYKNSVPVTKHENLTSQFEINNSNYDRTGLVYHYIKSNQDDSFATDVWIYYPDKFHSESFKIYPISKYQGFLDCICATYDKESFQFKEIDGKGVYKNGKIKSITTGTKKDFIRKTKIGNKTITTELGIAPCYDINFDLTDMNSMLPFLKDNKKDFTFGMTNIKKESALGAVDILYLGKAVCHFQEEKVYKGKNCSVFSLVLQNFEDLDGKVYIDTKTNDLIEINTKLCGNPFFESFKFTLKEEPKKMTREEWTSFMKAKAKKAL